MEIAEVMKVEAEAAEPERKLLHEQNQVVHKKLRREEKMKKRALHIEIVSEMIDLITDIADEAFDFQRSGQTEGGQLSKAMWRDWMKVFKDGKKVSEQNIVIQDVETETETSQKLVDPVNRMLNAIPGKLVPIAILEKFKNEPIFIEFL